MKEVKNFTDNNLVTKLSCSQKGYYPMKRLPPVYSCLLLCKLAVNTKISETHPLINPDLRGLVCLSNDLGKALNRLNQSI